MPQRSATDQTNTKEEVKRSVSDDTFTKYRNSNVT